MSSIKCPAHSANSLIVMQTDRHAGFGHFCQVTLVSVNAAVLDDAKEEKKRERYSKIIN